MKFIINNRTFYFKEKKKGRKGNKHPPYLPSWMFFFLHMHRPGKKSERLKIKIYKDIPGELFKSLLARPINVYKTSFFQLISPPAGLPFLTMFSRVFNSILEYHLLPSSITD